MSKIEIYKATKFSLKATVLLFTSLIAFAAEENCNKKTESMIAVKDSQNNINLFWFSQYEVTNHDFSIFVEATKYQTKAERNGYSQIINFNENGSSDGEWKSVPGVSWRRPHSNIKWFKIAKHPVVHITLEDALAYAAWKGHDIPTSLEWELGANQGKENKKSLFVAEPRNAQGKPTANFWQGFFPTKHEVEDGYTFTAPVGSYAESKELIAHDVIGNVWEITSTPFKKAFSILSNRETHQSAANKIITIKGGSFLCAENYCQNYHTYSSAPHNSSLPAMHIGFRTILRSCL